MVMPLAPKRPDPQIPSLSRRLADLTPREREVMTLVARGLTNDEIGAVLFISPTTAKTHVNRALAKTGCRDRTQLVILAYETGVVRAGERTGPCKTDLVQRPPYLQRSA
ncbi:hypothetical protein GCM10022223_42200 [Kineosporia mesophila]|uniref:HTH luxR-type domain-containing protein n=1 Tax=Kineosporia mesophila TaxID=566012 RepID=A0ABP6ZWI2_9ACTN|nr:helix-turn-helix transcriptional regulator [Kineosporia mesophila]MCD5355062.1 helix-turn-helix transcriptional regulator [Kineosporia mesophila]